MCDGILSCWCRFKCFKVQSDYLSFPNWDLTKLHHCQSIGVACTKYKLLVNGRKILVWLFEFTFASTNEQTLDWTESELICVQPTGTAWCCLEIRFQVLTRCPTEPIILAGNVIVLRKSLKTICSNLFHWCLKYYRQNDWRKKLMQFENCWRELSRVSLLANLAGSACLCGS